MTSGGKPLVDGMAADVRLTMEASALVLLRAILLLSMICAQVHSSDGKKVSRLQIFSKQ